MSSWCTGPASTRPLLKASKVAPPPPPLPLDAMFPPLLP
jgi:hypothetical protein